MSAALIIPAVCSRTIRWRLASVAVCLLLLLSDQVAAQPDDDVGAIDTGSLILPGANPDPDAPRPLAFKPIVPKPLTSADLPPSNPLIGGSLALTSVAFSRDWRAGRDEYRAIIERESRAFGLPPALVDAVMAVESRYNPSIIGMDGEVGLMQVMLPTARMLGFSGTQAQLAAPDINIHYGAKYLAGAWRLARQDLCTATMKYRAGHGETRFSFLSVNYCLRVRAHLAAGGAAVTGSVPPPTFGGPSGAHARSRLPSGGGTVNFAALNTRLRALTDRKRDLR